MDTILSNLESINRSLEQLANPYWANSQWFGSLLGAVVATLITLLVTGYKDNRAWRHKILNSWYLFIVKKQQPEHVFTMASMTGYGHTLTRNGTTEEIPEKPFAEKVLIEFRQSYKYWQLPLGRLRYFLWRYEGLIKKLPDEYTDLESTPEYIKAHEYYKKVIALAEKKTGENQWTIREP